ncbi:MAG: hypothetical protein WBR15_00125 [Gammaproteobacteria bacterium]
MRKLYFVLLVLSLYGCATSKLLIEHSVDTSQKTITVPPGNSGLLGNIKEALIQDGWQLETDTGPVETQGSMGATTALTSHQTFKSRYRLLINDHYYPVGQWCFAEEYDFDISVVDNQSGQEAFALSGTSCGPTDAVNKFMKALDGKS